MENFTREQVVPDVVSSMPKAKLTVEWNGKYLEPGAEWTPTQVKDEPSVQWEAEDDSLYTLIMTDPDAPNRSNPVNGEMLHWMVINIPGNDVTKGEEIVAYRGSGAPEGTGLHRYIFFVFKQSTKLQVVQEKADKFTVKPRRKFKIQCFIDKYGLGTAVAGNFFMAEYDDHVRIARAQIKDLD